MTVSDDTYVADLLRLAGGVNVYGGEAERYPATTPAESLARGADVHFFPDEPYRFRPEKHEEETARDSSGGSARASSSRATTTAGTGRGRSTGSRRCGSCAPRSREARGASGSGGSGDPGTPRARAC